MEIKEVEKIETKEPEGFYVGDQPTDFQKVIVKDGKVVDLLELITELANKVERAGLK